MAAGVWQQGQWQQGQQEYGRVVDSQAACIHMLIGSKVSWLGQGTAAVWTSLA
jgi:hypothetical protein